MTGRRPRPFEPAGPLRLARHFLRGAAGCSWPSSSWPSTSRRPEAPLETGSPRAVVGSSRTAPASPRGLVGCLLLSLLAGAGCLPDSATLRAGSVGEPAPEYRAETLDGEVVSLADYRGSPVLLNVWATWCPPCRFEIPELQKLHETHGPRGLRVVGVSIDAAGAHDDVIAFARSLGVGYEILRDVPGRALPAFSFHGVPGTALIDAEGIVRWRHLGPVTADDPALVTALAELFDDV